MSDPVVVVILLGASLVVAVIDLVRRRRRARRTRSHLANAPTPRLGTMPEPPSSVDWASVELGGGLEIKERLGQGGFGVVFRVEGLGSEWAMKVVAPHHQDPAARRELLHELSRLLLFDHPQVVRCCFFRTFGADFAIFTELVSGGTLSNQLRSRATSRVLLLATALEIAWALEALHTEGFVHRDVKPSNVLLDEGGHAKLADFGLAGHIAKSAYASNRLGTRAYWSVEQASGKPLTAASDVWSWGLTTLAMIAGEEPDHDGGHLAKFTSNAVAATVGHSPLFELLERCFEEEPENRPSIADCATRIAEMLEEAGVSRARPKWVAVRSRAGVALGICDDALAAKRAELREGRPELSTTVLQLALTKASLHRDGGDLLGAASTITSVLADFRSGDPATSLGWLEAGAAFSDGGDLDQAERSFSMAVASAGVPSTRAVSRHHLAITRWRRGDERRAAIDEAQAAIATLADLPDQRRRCALLSSSLAQLLFEAGDSTAAVVCLDHAIERLAKTELARVLLLRGRITHKIQDLERAADVLEETTPDARRLACEIAAARGVLAAVAGEHELAHRCMATAGEQAKALVRDGDLAASLLAATIDLHAAWVADLAGEARENVTAALATVDAAARRGDRHAKALLAWARTR